MRFNSKTEAYSYTLLLLTQLQQKLLEMNPSVTDGVETPLSEGMFSSLAMSPSPSYFGVEEDEATCIKDAALPIRPIQPIQVITEAIQSVKKSIVNHEQNTRVIAEILETIIPFLDACDIRKIKALQQELLLNPYAQSPQEKFENPLARRLESEISVAFLKNPTKTMMTSVGRVSLEILKLINDFPEKVKKFLFDYFTADRHIIRFGAPKAVPTLNEIKTLLISNNPEQIIEIMHAHFKFAQQFTRDIPVLNTPKRKPVGKLSEIIATIYSPHRLEDFFTLVIPNPIAGRYYRAYIADKLMYQSPLYTALPNRGRSGPFVEVLTTQMSLMLSHQEEYAQGLPHHDSTWGADCKCQAADLSSQYVIDLIDNNAVYVAGPSGMVSVLLSQMEILANFENEDLKKSYLLAVSAYIVGGGFHSLHEVISPAEYALNLVPGYQISIPVTGRLSPPPNYDTFFSQQAHIDPDFNARYELSWEHYISFLNTYYVPKYWPDLLPKNTHQTESFYNAQQSRRFLTIEREEAQGRTPAFFQTREAIKIKSSSASEADEFTLNIIDGPCWNQ